MAGSVADTVPRPPQLAQRPQHGIPRQRRGVEPVQGQPQGVHKAGEGDGREELGGLKRRWPATALTHLPYMCWIGGLMSEGDSRVFGRESSGRVPAQPTQPTLVGLEFWRFGSSCVGHFAGRVIYISKSLALEAHDAPLGGSWEVFLFCQGGSGGMQGRAGQGKAERGFGV